MSPKELVTSLAVFTVALGLGFAGFVAWKLQPHPDPQPLPAALTALDSLEGKNLLEEADALVDYEPLSDSFEHQTLVSFCGVASSVTVLNAMGRGLAQRTFFTEVTFHHADSSTLEDFRAALETNLSHEGDFLQIARLRRSARPLLTPTALKPNQAAPTTTRGSKRVYT